MMDVSVFIGRRIRFKNKIVVTSVAISFLVMIVAIAVSSGFRYELRDGLSEMTGDIRIGLPSQNYLDAESPICSNHSALPHISLMDEVEVVVPTIYRVGSVISMGSLDSVTSSVGAVEAINSSSFSCNSSASLTTFRFSAIILTRYIIQHISKNVNKLNYFWTIPSKIYDVIY